MVRVGIEATGPMYCFQRLLAELGHELWIGDSARIRGGWRRHKPQATPPPLDTFPRRIAVIFSRRLRCQQIPLRITIWAVPATPSSRPTPSPPTA